MYISSRAALVRNLGVALLNGSITLIILLIAPLGLAAVIINTVLVTVASFINATAGDTIVNFFRQTTFTNSVDTRVFRDSAVACRYSSAISLPMYLSSVA
ncbi:hypothetical protein NIES4074_63570 (plasmid) [Cylindrospermum sp. NIES-4074]|nr:hypothetical protein NIES4074_63570 [Cylindrospermum sp. NIES-4074]